MAYDAFISYSHLADEHLAPVVRKGLHRFAKPWNRGPILNVFLDNESLSAGDALSPAIESALRDARYLILLASYEAARPNGWVEKEIKWWMDHKEVEKLLIVVTAGTLKWSEESNDFEWSDATPLPELLRGRFKKEPIYVDLAWTRRGEDLDLRHSRFREAIRKLAATLHGKRPDELDGDDVRERRKFERFKRFAMTVIMVSLGLVAIFAWYAWGQRNTAIANEKRAIAGRLAAESRYELDKRIDLALLLAATAVDFEPYGPAIGALLAARRDHPRLDIILGRLESSVRQVAFGPHGKFAAVTEDGSLTLWHTPRSASLLWSLSVDDSLTRIRSVAFSQDDKLLAAGAEDGSVLFWDLSNGKLLPALESSGAAVRNLAFSPDGNQLAVTTADGVVTLWDVVQRQALSKDNAGKQNSFLAVSFHKDGRLLAVNATKDTLEVWDLTRHPPVRQHRIAAGVSHLAFNSDASGLIYNVGDNVFIWPLARSTAAPVTLSVRQGGIASLAISNDMKRFATGGEDGTVILWHRDDHALGEWFSESNKGAKNLTFSLDGKHLGTVTNADKLIVRDVGNRNVLREFSATTLGGEKKGEIYDLAFGPDKKLRAAIVADDKVTLWEIDNGRPLTTASAKHDAGVSSATTTADGKLLAIGGRDGTIILWDTELGKPKGEPLQGREQPPIQRGYGDSAVEQKIITALAFSDDGKRLLSVSGEEESKDRKIELTIWDLTASEPRKERVIEPRSSITAAAFSPGGTMIATAGGTNGTVILWDVPSLKQLGEPWMGHQSHILSVAFTPDGKRLAIGSGNGIFLGDVDPRAWQQRACVMANRNLTCSEWRGAFESLPYKKICADLPDPPEASSCTGTR